MYIYIYTVSTVLGLQMNALLGPMMLSFAQGLPTSGSLHDKVRLCVCVAANASCAQRYCLPSTMFNLPEYHPPPNQFQTSNTNESGAFRSFVFLRRKKNIEVGKEIQERQGFSPITELTIFKYWPYWRVGYWGEGPRNAKIGPQKIYLTIKQLGILKSLSILKYRECGYG